MTYGHDVPLLVNMQPAGRYLGERFHRAGGVPAVLCELLDAGKLHARRTDGHGPHACAKTSADVTSRDREMITTYAAAAASSAPASSCSAATCSTSRS